SNKKKITLKKYEKEKNRKILDEINNSKDYRKCFEILLEPNPQFHNYEVKRDQDLFYKICSDGLTELAYCLIDADADPFLEFNGDEKLPIHIASRHGYHNLLNLLLKKMDDRGEGKLRRGLQMTNKWEKLTIHNVVRSVRKKNKNEKRKEEECPEIDYYKCLEILLKYKEHYNIDAQDCAGNTALHYASQLRDDQRFTKLLLLNGAQMTIKNNKHITAKSIIVPSLIEEVLDDCITAEGDDSVEDDLKITIDLSIFSHRHDSETKTETDLLTALKESSTHKHLLTHPVISTFLYIKWQNIKTLWYTNLFFYMMFFACLISYICCYTESESPNYIARNFSLKIVISVMSVYMVLREIVQLCIFKLSYFKSFDNLLEISLLALTALLLYYPDSSFHHEFSAWIVVGSILEFILLIGKCPLFQSTIYITMFKRVTSHFLRIIAVLFFWIILAFSLSFFILFRGKIISLNKNATSSDGDVSFMTFKKAFMKTIVMSTGELEYKDTVMDLYMPYPLSSKLLLTLFIFVIVFVTVNLMNGIAVSDIKSIQKEAKNHAIMAEAECIIGINETLCKLIKMPYYDCFKRLWNYCLIFDDCLIKKRVSIFPNRHYESIWATCDGHRCRLSNIHHCPYYFWLNIWNCKELLHQLSYVTQCKKCNIYYDTRVYTTAKHRCDGK
ncbi:unnamed protein product, partial [Meganyctiphanes norvegica]